ncbi:hypothetical protein EDB83DRAFT_439245 [Lactarius deliciosus]|nr:hypothetical protein EDB83DRAFT_439245 [Lactarius deliciosus]
MTLDVKVVTTRDKHTRDNHTPLHEGIRKWSRDSRQYRAVIGTERGRCQRTQSGPQDTFASGIVAVVVEGCRSWSRRRSGHPSSSSSSLSAAWLAAAPIPVLYSCSYLRGTARRDESHLGARSNCPTRHHVRGSRHSALPWAKRAIEIVATSRTLEVFAERSNVNWGYLTVQESQKYVLYMKEWRTVCLYRGRKTGYGIARPLKP